MKTIISKIKNRRKHKVVFRLQSNGKKFCTVKFNDEEMFKIKLAAKYQDITVEQFLQHAIETAGKYSDKI